MILYTIIGSRSKIGQKIKDNLPNQFEYVEESKYKENILRIQLIFLAHNSKRVEEEFTEIINFPHIKLIDSSGFSKKKSIKGFQYFHYMLDNKIKSKYVSNPGCSAFGSLVIIEALRSVIETLHINAFFSQSAMSRIKEKHFEQENQSVYELDHFHKKEIVKYTKFNNNFQFTPYLSRSEEGIKLDFSGAINKNIGIEKTIKAFFKENKKIVFMKYNNEMILNTNDFKILIRQNNKEFFISVLYSNLDLAGANSSIEVAKKMLEKGWFDE